MPAKHVGQLCRRCNTLEAVLTVRSDPLCRECFIRYIHSKVVKRMEGFRTRHIAAGQERKLLLPLSFGVSSVSLLHVLDRHLLFQNEKTGRKGFSLHIVYVTSPVEHVDYEEKLQLLRKAYPSHEYTDIALDDLFENDKSVGAILDAAPSATALTDILTILRTRLIVHFAKKHNCEAVLWSDSTTKLAEKVLSETAKGRGFSLPWQVTDGPSPYDIPFHYPMRDVLKKELLAHAGMTNPPLTEYVDARAFEVTQAPPSAKNTTIDVLMKQYFQSVEENYPSIVSNVVRTTSKLHAPSTISGIRCRLCDLPVEASNLGIQGWGGYQEVQSESEDASVGLCYGCSRSLPEDAVRLLP